MALVTVFTDTETQYSLASNDTLVVGEGTTAAFNGTVVEATGSTELSILGNIVSGTDDAISVADGTFVEILVGENGSIIGQGLEAVDVRASHYIFLGNHGTISSTGYPALRLRGTVDAPDVEIQFINTGTLSMTQNTN